MLPFFQAHAFTHAISCQRQQRPRKDLKTNQSPMPEQARNPVQTHAQTDVYTNEQTKVTPSPILLKKIHHWTHHPHGPAPEKTGKEKGMKQSRKAQAHTADRCIYSVPRPDYLPHRLPEAGSDMFLVFLMFQGVGSSQSRQQDVCRMKAGVI